MTYPVRAVFTYDKYPTQEGNNMLTWPRRGGVNGTAVSRRRSRRFFYAEGPNMKTKERSKLL